MKKMDVGEQRKKNKSEKKILTPANQNSISPQQQAILIQWVKDCKDFKLSQDLMRVLEGVSVKHPLNRAKITEILARRH